VKAFGTARATCRSIMRSKARPAGAAIRISPRSRSSISQADWTAFRAPRTRPERGLLPAEPTICVGQANGARSEPSAAGRGDPLVADARGASLREGRRGSGNRSARGRRPGRRPCASLTPTASSGGSPRMVENWDAIQARAPRLLAERHRGDEHNLVAATLMAGRARSTSSFLWRPFKSSVNHRTFVPNVLPHRRFDPSRPRPGRGFPASCSRRRSADSGRRG